MRIGIFVLLACIPLARCATAPRPTTGFLDRSIVVGAASYPYVVFVPRNWSSDRNWPVILFLHGAGERGSDGLRQTQIGLGSEIRFAAHRIQSIVVFPQAPGDQRWIGAPADAAIRAVSEAVIEFAGDPDRIYLTGLSLGGFGTWHLALQHPEMFAALVPVCGGIVPAGTAASVRQSPLTTGAADPHAFTAERLRHIPVWIFHGAQDTVVLPSESRKMQQALNAAGADVRYTEYPDVGHNAWERAYGEAELWTWLFAQRRRAAVTAPAGPSVHRDLDGPSPDPLQTARR